VTKILSETEFVIYHEELRSSLNMKKIKGNEDLEEWIKLPPHTNVASCFDQFDYKDGERTHRFSLSETTK